MQTTTSASDGGFPTGVAHARRAKQGADFLGYRGVVYFTNDQTVLPDPREWKEYLRGAVSVLGRARVGAYGFGNAMDAARSVVDHFWQAGRRSEVRAFVQIWQDNNTQVTVGGTLCDRNLILKPLTTEEDVMNEQQFRVLVETQRRVSNTLAVATETQRRVTAGNAAITALSALVAKGTNGLTADQVSETVENSVTKALQENTAPVDVDA